MRPDTFAIGLPVVIVLAAILYLVVRNLVRLWLDHRVKMALLEELERHPELVSNYSDLREMLDGPAQQQEEHRRQRLIWTGIFLALIGSACALFAHTWLSGRSATGLYFGGVACVPLGFLLTLLGLLMKRLGHTNLPSGPDPR